MIDALPIPIFYKNSEGRYLGCNISFEKFFGQKKEQITAKSVHDLSPKEIADIYYEKDQALLQNPGIQIYESTVKDTMGVVHHVIFHKATFPNADGSVGGLIGAILDITERKRTEEEIRNLNDTLEQRISERTDELKKTITQLEEFNKLFVGRELKMIELKKRIAVLEQESMRRSLWARRINVRLFIC